MLTLTMMRALGCEYSHINRLIFDYEVLSSKLPFSPMAYVRLVPRRAFIKQKGTFSKLEIKGTFSLWLDTY